MSSVLNVKSTSLSGFWFFLIRVYFNRYPVGWGELWGLWWIDIYLSTRYLQQNQSRLSLLREFNNFFSIFMLQYLILPKDKQFHNWRPQSTLRCHNISQCLQLEACKPNKAWKWNFVIQFMILHGHMNRILQSVPSSNLNSSVYRSMCGVWFHRK